MESLPTRERGLKRFSESVFAECVGVAPYAGAWIETGSIASNLASRLCRSLRGSVD